MAMKTLRRTVIIRESDLEKLLYTTIKKGLYDRYEIEPMTYQAIQNDILVAKLKDPDLAGPTWSTLPNLYENMLYKEKSLYNRKYLDWKFTMDFPAGQIYVQSKDRFPREPLHHVTLERDY